MGSGASSIIVPPASRFELTLTRQSKPGAPTATTSVSVAEGGAKVTVVRSEGGGTERDPSLPDFSEVELDEDTIQALLRYLNAEDQLVPDADAADDSEEYGIPTADFPAVPGYVCLTVGGRFSGEAFRRVCSGVLDGVLLAEAKGVAPDVSPSTLKAKPVRPVFARQKSQGDKILEATVADEEKRTKKSNWLARQARVPAIALPISHAPPLLSVRSHSTCP